MGFTEEAWEDGDDEQQEKPGAVRDERAAQREQGQRVLHHRQQQR
jgi:hypothetical protein